MPVGENVLIYVYFGRAAGISSNILTFVHIL